VKDTGRTHTQAVNRGHCLGGQFPGVKPLHEGYVKQFWVGPVALSSQR